MQRVILGLLSLVMLTGFFTVVLPATPASADRACTFLNICGQMKHYAPDEGYAPPIIMRCNANSAASRINVRVGDNSDHFCEDVGSVYVRSGEEIWCKVKGERLVGWHWSKYFDATGWHPIKNTFNDGAGCTLRRDAIQARVRAPHRP